MGASNKQGGKSRTFLKIYSKEPGVDQKAAFFGKQEKVDGKWQVTQRFNELTGKLIGAEHVVNTFGKDEFNTLRLVLEDHEGTWQVEGSFNSLTYNIINALSSINSFNGLLAINLYVNKSGWPTAYITLEGEKVSWKYEISEIPEVVYVRVGNKDVPDSSAKEAFFIKLISDIAGKLGGTEADSAPELRAAEVDYDFDPDDDSLPF
jgi:hypothetical protein